MKPQQLRGHKPRPLSRRKADRHEVHLCITKWEWKATRPKAGTGGKRTKWGLGA